METTTAGMTAVTFTLLDGLFNRLIDKGVLTQEDQVAIFERARDSLTSSEDPQMREAAKLLDHLYRTG